MQSAVTYFTPNKQDCSKTYLDKVAFCSPLFFCLHQRSQRHPVAEEVNYKFAPWLTGLSRMIRCMVTTEPMVTNLRRVELRNNNLLMNTWA